MFVLNKLYGLYYLHDDALELLVVQATWVLLQTWIIIVFAGKSKEIAQELNGQSHDFQCIVLGPLLGVVDDVVPRPESHALVGEVIERRISPCLQLLEALQNVSVDIDVVAGVDVVKALLPKSIDAGVLQALEQSNLHLEWNILVRIRQ